MAWLSRTMVLSGLASGVFTLALHADGAQIAGLPAPQPNSAQHRPEQFVGLWVYNADESVNAATGRPERAPRSATQRNAGARSGAGGPAASAGGGGGRGSTYAGGRGPGSFGSAGQLGPTVAMIQENRSLTRDLLEVPEAFTIKIAPDAVTFVDDLERERTYATNGLRQRLQIGAARFNAATFWSGSYLEKKIDAADGFRMTEVYFLSEDGRRLFVILRVGSERKNSAVMGINRVYDRADQ